MNPFEAVGLAAREQDRLRRVRRYSSDTFALAREILGYDRLTESFHRPILEEWDRRDAAYDRGEYHKDQLDLWPRDHYKTTCVIARIIKRFLKHPGLTVTWYHAVEEKAKQSAYEIGHHLQTNKELRELLDPGAKPLPVSRAKKWNAAGGWRLPANEGRKDSSMTATGASSESTGGHSMVVVLDDIVGQKTIDDSMMPRVRNWIGQTVNNVLDTGGQLYAIGTIWDEDDVWNDMLRNPQCDVTVRDCGYTRMLEQGVRRDSPRVEVLYPMKVLHQKRMKPGWTDYTWSCQMENDPLPASARRWVREREQVCSLEEALAGKGVTVVLSDPAPAGLSVKGAKDKQRGETGKDYWSIAVVRLRQHGDYSDLILLDGERGQDWTEADGFRVACRFLKRYKTRYFFNESYAGDAWTVEFLRQARLEGIKPYLERRDSEWKLPRYKDSYANNQKNLRFESLVSLNSNGQFWMCRETCPREFLEGDGDKTGFLTQMRKWMPLSGGRNNLKWDDDADCVARATDSAVQKLAPRKAEEEEIPVQSPFRPLVAESRASWSTRHIRFF